MRSTNEDLISPTNLTNDYKQIWQKSNVNSWTNLFHKLIQALQKCQNYTK
jgi:hypothetical protein